MARRPWMSTTNERISVTFFLGDIHISRFVRDLFCFVTETRSFASHPIPPSLFSSDIIAFLVYL